MITPDTYWIPTGMQSEDDSLTWLMRWYASQCNDDWEHSYGVKIDTLDNPGWNLRIDLAETALAGRPFEPIELKGDEKWMVAKVEGNQFVAYGGSHDLPLMIETFRAWVMETGRA